VASPEAVIAAGIERRPFAWRPAGLIAFVVTALLLATANGYDYHRDELYFRMLGRHPQWGYVDQPPFTPLLTRLCIDLFGDHLWAIRVPGALLLGGAVLVAAAIARDVGGGAVAQSSAAAGVAGVFGLVSAHVASTTTPDLVVWLAVLLFVVRALLHGRDRAWLGAGLVAGLGLYNKQLVVLLLLCLGAGLLLAGPRRALLNRWLWLGVALALLVGLPNVLYQVFNDYPQAHMASAIAADKGADSRTQLVPLQLVLVGPTLVPVWVAGLVVLLRDPRLRPIRALALAYPLMLVVVLVTGGQPYYPLGLVVGLFAIGAVPTERWLRRRRANRWALGVAVAVNVVVAALFALPLLPPDRLGPIAGVNIVAADQIGWPEYVGQIAGVYAALPAEQQRRAVLFTGNYGEAGALDRYGPAYGLPAVYSGQNELHHYGPPPESATVAIVVSQAPPARIDALFGGCEAGAALHNSAGVENEELDARVFVCRRVPSWRALWPTLQHFD
jgi:4-amino-4-deoxy-L-arabinose transferase-like glycosyltransferase